MSPSRHLRFILVMLTNLKLVLDISQNVIQQARRAVIAIFLAYSESETSDTDVS